MKELVAPFYEGFLGSFMLAGVLVASVFGGAFRVFARIATGFVRHQPISVGPNKSVTLP